MDELHVDKKGNILAFGKKAHKIFMVESNREFIRSIPSNPNYVGNEHPFWFKKNSSGVPILLPALVEPGDAPDIMLYITR